MNAEAELPGGLERSAKLLQAEQTAEACRGQLQTSESALNSCKAELAACQQDRAALQGVLQAEQQHGKEAASALSACQRELQGCRQQLAACQQELQGHREELGSCKREKRALQEACSGALHSMLQHKTELCGLLRQQVWSGHQALLIAIAQGKQPAAAVKLPASCSLHEKLAVIGFTLRLVLSARQAVPQDGLA